MFRLNSDKCLDREPDSRSGYINCFIAKLISQTDEFSLKRLADHHLEDHHLSPLAVRWQFAGWSSC